MDGLRFKTWRMRPGEWFEGCYVFADRRGPGGVPGDASPPAPPTSPGSQIIGSAPVLIEACDVVAVAEGGDGFRRRARRA